MSNKVPLFIQPLDSDECGDDCPMLIAHTVVGGYKCAIFDISEIFDWVTYRYHRPEACKNLEWNLKKHD